MHQSLDDPQDGGRITTVILLIAEPTANAACMAGCVVMRPASTFARTGRLDGSELRIEATDAWGDR
ncbi:hypothetical protein ACFZAT_18385 [Streptomyces sp. NPDC008163]|uniref:hypothetical protein n=1 Tax=Streptomyces sp. NPDC008163 TaxID=3364818 RepID=UPI0036E9BC5F